MILPAISLIGHSAILNQNKSRRYLLSRTVGEGRTWLFVGLNPSMADAENDDPTVRRLIAFTRAWSFGRLLVCNLFSLISPEPEALRGHVDPVGQDNDAHILAAVAVSSLVVAGWGAFHQARERAAKVLASGVLGQNVQCFGRNRDGSPKHPLYLRRDTILEPLETHL